MPSHKTVTTPIVLPEPEPERQIECRSCGGTLFDLVRTLPSWRGRPRRQLQCTHCLRLVCVSGKPMMA